LYLTDRAHLGRAERRRGRGRGIKQRVSGTVVLLGLVSMFTDISSESVSAVLPIYLVSELGISIFAYGFIDGIYQGVTALVRILGGWAADRGDHPKWVAFFGYGISAISRIALIPSHSFAAITAVITVDRLGKGVRTAPRDALIAASSAPESLGRAFGVHRALDTVGALLGPLIAFAILGLVPGDYRAVFVVSFAAAIIGLAILLLVVPDLRPRRAAATDRGEGAEPGTATDGPSTDGPANTDSSTSSPVAAPRPSLRLLLDPRLGRVLSTAGLLGVLTIGDGFLYLALQDRANLHSASFPLLYVGTNLAYFAFAIPFGQLADRVGRRRVFLAGHVFLLAAYLCVGGPVGGLPITICCLLLLGAYYASTDGVLSAFTSRLVGPSIRASGIATAQTVVATARFASSLAFGLLWTLIGQRSAVLVVAAALALAIPIAWWLLRDTESPVAVLARA
jgi:MFS family permease